MIGKKDEPSTPAQGAPEQKQAKAAAAPEQTAEQKEAQKRALQTAPAFVREQAERTGGEVPRAAPKAGEGTNPDLTTTEHPELEPPVPPTEYRAAPPAPGTEERAKWSGGRPTIEDLEDADYVEVRTVDPASAGFFVAGIRVDRFGVRAPLLPIRKRGEAHLSMLATDPRVEVRIVDSLNPADDTTATSAKK